MRCDGFEQKPAYFANFYTDSTKQFVDIKLFRIRLGMNALLSHETRKLFMRVQMDHIHELDMSGYFEELAGKTLTIQEFEVRNYLVIRFTPVLLIARYKLIGVLG